MSMKKLKRSTCLAAAALILTAGLTVGEAMAYFTTYATAEGGVKIDLGFTETMPKEEVVNGQKIVTLKNTGDHPCYVRLKALTGDAYKENLTYSEPEGNSNWKPDADGYYCYTGILAPGEETSKIHVSFSFPEEEPADFNVIIIQENTPVLYDEDGNPYADWDRAADVSYSYYN